MALAGELIVSQLPVVVVNPRHMKGLVRATGKLAMVDSLGVQVLVHFAGAM